MLPAQRPQLRHFARIRLQNDMLGCLQNELLLAAHLANYVIQVAARGTELVHVSACAEHRCRRRVTVAPRGASLVADSLHLPLFSSSPLACPRGSTLGFPRCEPVAPGDSYQASKPYSLSQSVTRSMR